MTLSESRNKCKSTVCTWPLSAPSNNLSPAHDKLLADTVFTLYKSTTLTFSHHFIAKDTSGSRRAQCLAVKFFNHLLKPFYLSRINMTVIMILIRLISALVNRAPTLQSFRQGQVLQKRTFGTFLGQLEQVFIGHMLFLAVSPNQQC